MKSNFPFALFHQRVPSNIRMHAQESPFILYFKTADLVTLLVLNELMDSDNEKSQRGKLRNWIKRSRERGYFNNIIQELRIEDRFGFREMFRMDVTDFENILAKISDIVSPKKRLGGTNPAQADERLALTLRFLATGETFQSLSFQYRISVKAVSYIAKGCCKAIVERIPSNFIKVPSTEAECLGISKRFEKKWNFPHALRAIGKYVRIQKPKNVGSFYYICKHTHSIILMAIAGPEYKCLYADVGCNGRVNDFGIWNKTYLLQGMQDGSVKLPNDEKLPNGEITPYVFLGMIPLR